MARTCLALLTCLGTAAALAGPVYWPADLAREAKDAPPAVAAALRAGAEPADELMLAEGTVLRVAPLREHLDAIPRDAAIRVNVGGKGEPRELPRNEVRALKPFEEVAAQEAKKLLDGDDPVSLRAAELLLSASLRLHLSRRSPPAAGRWAPPYAALEDGLVQVRRSLLQRLPEAEAVALAKQWESQVPETSPLRDDLRGFWLRQAEAALKTHDLVAAKRSLDRLERDAREVAGAEPVRAALQKRATDLAAEAKELPDAQAVRKLQEAMDAWPRLPGLRDELDRRRDTYRAVEVAVPAPPELLSPALAWTDVERQCLALVFEPLVKSGRDGRHPPGLIERPPAAGGSSRPLDLRRDVYWPDGARFTAADVRHTVRLQTQPEVAGRYPAWREWVEPPRADAGPFRLTFGYRQGLLDPLAPLAFAVLPQHHQGKPLSRADDVEFGRRPTGTGPFQLAGRKTDGGREGVVFKANPAFVRADRPFAGNVRELRLAVWPEPTPGKDFPHLVLNPAGPRVVALRKAGYTVVTGPASRRVYYLAFNHRRDFARDANLRRAVAHAVDRRGLVDRHFRDDDLPADRQPAAVNGLFPRDGWAAPPPPRVPADLFSPELARSFAKKAKTAPADLTIKHPADDPRLGPACEELAGRVTKAFSDAGLKVTVRTEALPAAALWKAAREGDFDLLYHHLDEPHDLLALWALFDAQEAAVAPGGTNVSGYDGDATLQSLLRSALSHRHFPAVQESARSVHAHLHDVMPVVPLWQLPATVAVHPSLQAPGLDPWEPFADVLSWNLTR